MKMGLFALGFILFIVGAISACLGGALVDWDSESDHAKDGRIAVYVSAIVAVLGCVMIFVGIYTISQRKLVRYHIEAHYLNGEVRRMTMEGYREPRIESYRGSYFVKTEFNSEPAVIRYELIDTDTIK